MGYEVGTKKSKWATINEILSKRLALLFLAVVFFALPFLVYIDIIREGNCIVGGDGISAMFYFMKNMGESLKAGEFPMWSTYVSGGQPLFNYYIPMILCSLLPLSLQIPSYFGFHFALGGVCLFLYLKRIGCVPTVALTASFIYLFTVHMGGARKEHVLLIISALYVPVVLFLIETYLQRNRFKWLFAASVAMGWQVIGGMLQYCIYSDIFFFFYLLYFGIKRKISIKTMLTHGSAWFFSFFAAAMVFVLPLAVLVITLTDGGGVEMTYDQFCAYSLHPIKLLMVVFPYIFGDDICMPLSENGWNISSEMDIELLIGAAALAIIIAGVSLLKGNKYARFMTVSGCVLFAYACMDNVPLLGNIVYHIPILSLFRCPSRTLFIFTFCNIILIALALNKLCESERFEERINRIQYLVLAAVLSIPSFYCLANLFMMLYHGKGTELLIPWSRFEKVFFVPLLSYVLYLVVFYILRAYKKRGKLSQLSFSHGVSIILLIVTVVQTYPFYSFANTGEISYLVEPLPQAEEADASTAKAWASEGWGFLNYNFNRGVEAHMGMINSYPYFQTNSLYKYLAKSSVAPLNYSGLYLYPPNFIQNLKDNNEFLSAFGIKYLITSPSYELESLENILDIEEEKELLNITNAEFKNSEGYKYAQWDFEPEKDTYYFISAEIAAAENSGKGYFDFYGIDYDDIAQQKEFVIEKGKNLYSAVLNSGDPQKSKSPIQARIIVLTEQELGLENIKVAKVKVKTEKLYQLIKEGSGWKLYENTRAKDLVFVPEYIEYIPEENRNDLYVNTENFDLFDTAYLFGEEVERRANYRGTTKSIETTNNTITAVVNASGETLFIASQTYYPGWHAYIDGQKAELHEVDGIMQGVFVPQGEHLIEFRFEPWYVYLGAAISSIMLICCIVTFIVSKVRRKNDAIDTNTYNGEHV